MTAPASRSAAAVHVGADLLDNPRHAGWARLLSCRDTVQRLSRLCHAAGVRNQRRLLGADATIGRVREAITDSAAAVGPGGLLVLSFSGHSERPLPGQHRGGWCLRDAALRHTETAGLLTAAPSSAHVVVVADTCYATASARVFARVPATTVLVAACAENQATLNYPVSEFITTLQRLTFPDGTANPDCASYAWLRHELRKDTPDVERPDVCANRPHALQLPPFQAVPRRRPPTSDNPRHVSIPGFAVSAAVGFEGCGGASSQSVREAIDAGWGDEYDQNIPRAGARRHRRGQRHIPHPDPGRPGPQAA